MDSSGLAYQRILLKLSGTAFNQEAPLGIDSHFLQDLVAIHHLGVEIGIVVGGGNVVRGNQHAQFTMDRIAADQIGMLSTLINALVLRESLRRARVKTRIMSAFPVGQFIAGFERDKAIRNLKKKRVVIFAGGTGNPLASTDSAASLRAIETDADILLKATDVDGIYSMDPKKNRHATLLKTISYQEALVMELGVMDLTAFYQCRDHHLPIRVFNMHQPGVLSSIIRGEAVGTLVDGDK
jgi:uridylate kinase